VRSNTGLLVVRYYFFSLGITTIHPPNHYDLDQTIISHPAAVPEQVQFSPCRHQYMSMT